MAESILMPRLSDTMTEGVIAAWHKKVGDSVKKGDLLAEVETDKATMELESYKDGTLLHIGTEKGGKLQVNDLLAVIGNKDEDISSLLKDGAPAPAESEKPATSTSASSATSTSATGPAAKPEETAKKSTAAPAAEKKAAPLDISKMEEVVLMPRLSDTMTDGVIAGWLKNVGDTVKKGDVLAEIETDKATMELESYKNGKLLFQGAKKGEKIAVNDLLCIIGEEGKVDVNAIVAAAHGGGSADGAAGAIATNATNATNAADAKMTADAGADTSGSATSNGTSGEDAATTGEDASHDDGLNGRVKASPLARKLAAEKGIDLSKVNGSGDNGRVTKSDIDNYKAAPESKTAPATNTSSGTAAVPGAKQTDGEPSAPAKTTPATEPGKVSFEDVPVSQMRKVIAKRLSESIFTAPHFYLTMVIDMDAAVASRAKLNEVSKVKISFNDLVLKACAVALRQHPAVNSSWLGDKIRYNHHVNIGVAVAVEEGLLVPVVRFADSKSLSVIAGEVKEFAQKAKDKKLQPADWEGNTFTISNLGMFGIDEFTAIINPPDACILAIGGISQVPVVKNGQIVIGNVMKVTLSCDHRVVDGAKGSAFLQTLKSLLEEPLRMLV